MDKRATLAIVLSVVIWIGWQKIYMEPIQKANEEHAAREKALREQSLQQGKNNRASALEKNTSIKAAQNTAPGNAAKVAAAGKAEAKTAPQNYVEKVGTYENDSYLVALSNGPYLFSKWELKKYGKTLDAKDGIIDMSEVTGYSKQMRVRFDDTKYAAVNDSGYVRVKSDGEFVDKLSTEFVNVTRTSVAQPENYHVKVQYSFQFKDTPPKYVFVDFIGNPKRPNDDGGSIFGQQPDKVQVTFRGKEGRESYIADTLEEDKEFTTGAYWFGVDTRYFVLAALPGKEIATSLGVEMKNVFIDGKKYVRGSLAIPTNGQTSLVVPFDVYFGPKNLKNLEAVGPALADALDFGWFSALAIPILQSLKFLYSYVGNYGVAIILLTLFIKILLYPLTYKGMKSMAKMSKLQPVIANIREKYKDDKERLNQEMLNLMKTQGYNPLGGCLPILVQMPVFFALYRVLFNSMELFHAPFILWIHDLSAPDPLFITPVLLVGLMWFQQKLTPNPNMDPAQAKVMQMMPVMFGFFMVMLPAGLNIYMAVNSAVSIAQQHYLNKKFGVYENAAKAAQAKKDAEKKTVKKANGSAEARA